MPLPTADRKSPNPLVSSQSSLELSRWDLPEAPLDLLPLSALLRARKTTIQRKRKNLKVDESRVLGDLSKIGEARRHTLAETLDYSDEQVAALGRIDRLSISTPQLLPPPATRKGQGASPGPSRYEEPLASPLPIASNARPKIKIKRDPDRERSTSLAANGSSSVIDADDSNIGASTSRLGQDPSFEADPEDEAPLRVPRLYQVKRKRQRNSLTRDQDEISISDFGSPQPSVLSQRMSPTRETPRPYGATPSSTIKLKLNPTTHTVPSRNENLTGALRRASLLRSRDDFQLPMTPMQASQAAMWELPKRTPDTYIPKLAPTRPIRSYPTRPEEVDVDFAKMDWRERDKERDRIEAAAAAMSASNGSGPGPGQAVVKESNAKGKDKKQDQVAHQTFQQWADGWFRTLTEEDLAWLSSKPDELEAFQFPSLGRHYSEVWEEEESSGALIPTVYLPGGNAVGSLTAVTTAVGAPILAPHNGSNARAAVSSNSTSETLGKSHHDESNKLAQAPDFDPRNLKDDHLYGGSSEDARSGPLTERLLAALLPVLPTLSTDSDMTSSSQINGLSATPHTPPPPTMNGDANGILSNGTHQSGSNHLQQQQQQQHHHQNHQPSLYGPTKPQTMSEFEERLRRELKAIDILGDETIDWSERADDEISSTLRKVQRLLRKQTRINEMRKTRLFEIALDRMAYQDYLGCLNSVEREIESGWLRRQTQIRKSMQAQKKKKGGASTSSSSSTTTANANGSYAAINGPIAAVMAAEAHNTTSPSTPGAAIAMIQSGSSTGTERGGGPIAPQFSEALISAMKKREQLRYAFEPLFAGKPLANYTPKIDESIYSDLDLS